MFLFNGEFCEFSESLRRLIGGELLEELAQVGRVLRGFGWLACDFCAREVVRLILEFAVSKSF